MRVGVGLALPRAGKTEVLATQRFGSAGSTRMGTSGKIAVVDKNLSAFRSLLEGRW